MSSIVRRSASVSVLHTETENFHGTLKNIQASADNSAAIAMSSAAIENSTAATAQNTARMLYEQMETNLRLDQGLQLQNLQVRLAIAANEELRSIDSTVRTLSQTVAAVGDELRQSNSLLKHNNDLLGQSLEVQTELLNAIKSEHARLELDRKAKRLIYELEQVLERVKAESSPLVRAFAANLMLHQTGASGFSLDGIFEVADKRALDDQRKQIRALIDDAGDEVKDELSRFDDACRRYFEALAIDAEAGFAPAQRQQLLMPDVETDEAILPPFVGERAMSEKLAAKLNAILVSLHEKRKRAKGFYLLTSVVAGAFGLLAIALMFRMPLFGILLLLLFAVSAFVLLLTPLGLRWVTLTTGIDMDPTPERKFLAELQITEAGAATAVTAWAEHLRKIQLMRNNLAKESAMTKKTNEQIRQANARAADWNQRRAELVTAVREEQKKAITGLRTGLEAFMMKYPSLRQWWTFPEQLAV